MNFSLFSKKYERSEVVEVSAQEMLAATNKLRAVNAEAELKRTEIILQATNGKRSFELARTDRLNSSWVGAGLSFNQEIRYAIGRLQALSRDLAQNDPYVKKFLTTYSNYIIGPESFTVKNKAYDWGKNEDGSPLKTYDTYANSVIEENFNEFCNKKNFTIDKKQSMRQFLATCVRSKIVDGEVFIKFCYTGTKQNKFGMAMQAIESSMVPVYLNKSLENGNIIVMGIEYDLNRMPVAYYFRKSQKGVDFTLQYYWNDFERVEATDVLHYYDIEFVGQLRGYPQLVAVANRIKTMKGYEDAALINARSAAMKNIVLQRSNNQIAQMSKPDIQGAVEDENGDLVRPMEPGETYVVPDGYEVVEHNPSYPQGEHKAFIENMLYSVASGLCIDYPTLSSNLSGVNYTSIRHGMMDSRINYKVKQADIREIIIEPIFERVLTFSISMGLINLPISKLNKFNKPRVIGFTAPWVDPLKDGRAQIEGIESKTLTLEGVLAENGIDFDDHVDQLAYEQNLLKKRGIILPAAQARLPLPVEEQPAAPPPAKSEENKN